MVGLMDAIRQRRSIRRYTQQSLTVPVIREILAAAVWAPSAHNAQPWRFIVLTEENGKCALAEAMSKIWLQDLEKDGVPKSTCEASMRASTTRFLTAPALILACLSFTDMDMYPDEKRRKCEHDLAVQSLGAAIQNLLLAAHAKKLGACWYCAPIFCKDVLRQTLNIPEDVEPHAIIVLGYPAEQPSAPLRKPLTSMVFAEKWGKPL